MPVPALLGPALTSFLPSLFGKLFGDPQKKYRRQVNKLTSPRYTGQLTKQFYDQLLQSPAFSQAQGSIAAGANQAGGQIAQSLAARGLGTSGTGAILPGLVSSMVGGQQAGLRTATFQSAQQQAKDRIAEQLAALGATQGPSPAQGLFAGGLEAFLPYLQNYLQRGRGGLQPDPTFQESLNNLIRNQ